MFCLKCGAELTEGAKFCKACGAEATPLDMQPAQGMGYGQNQFYQPPEPMNPPIAPFGSSQGFNRASYGAPMSQKEAKAAYKQARKAAGGPGAGKVVGVIVIILVVAALAAGATWLFMGHDLFGFRLPGSTTSSSASTNEEAGGSEESQGAVAGTNSSASAEAVSASSASSGKAATGSSTASASSSGSADGLSSYIGTWRGEFTEQAKLSGLYRCYGAEKVPMELTITDIGNSGRITANVKLLFHGHGNTRKADVASTDGDTVIEAKDLVGTINDKGSFELATELPDGMGDLKLSFKTVDQANGTRQLQVFAKSEVSLAVWYGDSYTLTKE